MQGEVRSTSELIDLWSLHYFLAYIVAIPSTYYLTRMLLFGIRGLREMGERDAAALFVGLAVLGYGVVGTALLLTMGF